MVSKTSHIDTESGRVPLQRESIVQTALALMNEIGLDALSLRRLADELHVQAPALYWHFKNKQELLNEMATAMLMAPRHDGATPDDLLGGDWQTWLLRMGHFMRDALLQYRDGVRLLAVAEVSTVSIQFMDMSLGVLVRAGFDPRSAIVGISTIVNYTMGFTFEEQASPRGPEAIEAFHDLVRSADLPYLKAAFGGAIEPVESSEEFRLGLQLLIAGMKAQLEAITH